MVPCRLQTFSSGGISKSGRGLKIAEYRRPCSQIQIASQNHAADRIAFPIFPNSLSQQLPMEIPMSKTARTCPKKGMGRNNANRLRRELNTRLDGRQDRDIQMKYVIIRQWRTRPNTAAEIAVVIRFQNNVRVRRFELLYQRLISPRVESRDRKHVRIGHSNLSDSPVMICTPCQHISRKNTHRWQLCPESHRRDRPIRRIERSGFWQQRRDLAEICHTATDTTKVAVLQLRIISTASNAPASTRINCTPRLAIRSAIHQWRANDRIVE